MQRSPFLCSAMVAFIAFSSTTATPFSFPASSLNPASSLPLNTFMSLPREISRRNDAKRYIINCTDTEAAFDVSCWGQLDLSNWLNNPTTGWNKTTPVCNATQDSANCCIPGEAWTTCFLRLGHRYGGADCTQINVQTCSLDLTQKAPSDITAQVHYVMKNIYAINNFFTTYWSALNYAAGQAGLVIQSMVNELNPPADTGFPWLNILSALSFGLAFLGAPSIAVGLLSLEQSVKYAAQGLLISVTQAPGFSKAMWPSGTSDSKSVQVGNLNDELTKASQQMAGMINTAVQLLMSDMPTFVAFAESGRFSGAQSMSLPAKTDGLDYALTTYLLSETMAKNGWYASPYLGPYPTAASVTSKTYPGFGCKMGANNVCTTTGIEAYYWSQSTQRVYSLSHPGRTDKDKTPVQLTQDIVSKGWAALDVLFDGAYNCTAEGKAGSAAINFNWDGTLDIACISQLPVKIACFTPCISPLINGKCPFPTVKDPCKW